MITFKEGLRNPETGAVRYAFTTDDPDTIVVVKYFDKEQKERATVKWFIGSYDKVREYWRTHESVPADRVLLDRAVSVIYRAVGSVAGSLGFTQTQ